MSRPAHCGRLRTTAPFGPVTWPNLVFAVLLGWLAVALLVGTFVGHGIALGAPDID